MVELMFEPRRQAGQAPLLAVLLGLTGGLAAQAAVITEERVRETVGWLAADERNGRGTGSPELAAASDWLADRFAKAGLKQVSEGSWFHEFSIPALRVDSDQVKLTLTCRVDKQDTDVELKAGRDVRQWTPSDGVEGEESCTVAASDDPVLRRLLRARAARRPIVIEVAEDHAFWQAAKGKHAVIVGRRKAARPIFLVREGLLPAAGANKSAEWSANWSVAPPEKVDLAQRNVVALLAARVGSYGSD